VKYTDGKIVSGFEKLAKPDPRIYELLFERYSLDPTECVFLDDRQVNIDAAMKLGMKTILFTDHDSARKKLDEMLG
jgi:putative hydrolase of the HAD superfamily